MVSSRPDLATLWLTSCDVLKTSCSWLDNFHFKNYFHTKIQWNLFNPSIHNPNFRDLCNPHPSSVTMCQCVTIRHARDRPRTYITEYINYLIPWPRTCRVSIVIRLHVIYLKQNPPNRRSPAKYTTTTPSNRACNTTYSLSYLQEMGGRDE